MRAGFFGMVAAVSATSEGDSRRDSAPDPDSGFAAALRAALYDTVHDGTPGDRGHYTDVCQGTATVLELGCGGGRLLPVLAGSTRRVVAIDFDPALLARARAVVAETNLGERVTLQLADMRSFTTPERFDRVILAFNGLWCLPGIDAIDAALGNAVAHLADGGRVALDVYRTDAFHAESQPDDVADDTLHPVACVEVDGTTWDVRERSVWDRPHQRITATYVHEAADGRQVTTDIVHHYLLESEVIEALRRAGLPNVRVRHGLARDESLLVEAWR